MRTVRSFQSWCGVLCCGLALGLMPGVASGGETIDFVIDDGKVVPSEDFAVKVSVLGAAIGYQGEDWPVTVAVDVGADPFEPFGESSMPLSGDVNDHSPAKHFVLPQGFDSNAEITITATSWRRKSGYSGTLNSHYKVVYSRNSHDQSPYVKVLRDGDAVPDIPAFENQASIVDFVENYIDVSTGRVSLDVNQVIYLFELGTSNLNSSYADFQDLVVLVTLGESPEMLQGSLTAQYD